MKLLLSAALLVGSAFAASAPVSEVVSECVTTPKGPGCRSIDGGYVMQFSQRDNPVVKVYGPDGRFRVDLTVALAKAPIPGVYDVAVDSDGSFVVAAGSSTTAKDSARGVVFFGASGTQTSVIDTGTWEPWHVTIAPDHSIWVMGHEGGFRRDYNLVRRYSRAGELLGSFVPRTAFGKAVEAGEFFQAAGIQAAGDKIAMAIASDVGAPLEVILLDAQGNTLGRMQSPAGFLGGWGFTSDGKVYAGFRDKLWRLDVMLGTSHEVDDPAPGYGLAGANGKDLVFQNLTKEGHVNVASFAQPAAN
jgi:hypothetical protein